MKNWWPLQDTRFLFSCGLPCHYHYFKGNSYACISKNCNVTKYCDKIYNQRAKSNACVHVAQFLLQWAPCRHPCIIDRSFTLATLRASAAFTLLRSPDLAAFANRTPESTAATVAHAFSIVWSTSCNYYCLKGYSGFKNPYARLFFGFNIMFDHKRVHVPNILFYFWIGIKKNKLYRFLILLVYQELWSYYPSYHSKPEWSFENKTNEVGTHELWRCHRRIILLLHAYGRCVLAKLHVTRRVLFFVSGCWLFDFLIVSWAWRSYDFNKKSDICWC